MPRPSSRRVSDNEAVHAFEAGQDSVNQPVAADLVPPPTPGVVPGAEVPPSPAIQPIPASVPNDKAARAREAVSEARVDKTRADKALYRAQHATARSRALGDTEAGREATAINTHHLRIAAKQTSRAERWLAKTVAQAERFDMNVAEVLRAARVVSLAAQLAQSAAYYCDKYAPGSERDALPEAEVEADEGLDFTDDGEGGGEE